MVFLEIGVDLMNLSGVHDLNSLACQVFSFANLLAALFLARNLKKPKK